MERKILISKSLYPLLYAANEVSYNGPRTPDIPEKDELSLNSGTYCLILRLDKPKAIQIGRLGRGFFQKGHYVYVGSALNRLEQRIGRHLSPQKKIHWHIDYLLEYARVIDTRAIISPEKRECTFSEKVGNISRGIPMEGFGSSDCRCSSHLHFFSENPLSHVQFERIWQQEVPPSPHIS